MSKLSEDVIINVLVRLPVKSILRFRCVCKQWLKLFSEHTFIKLHFDIATENDNLRLMVSGESMYSMNFDSIFHKVVKIDYPFKSRNWGMSVVGSCNGLLCIANIAQTICIWNPSTKMHKEIPSLPTQFLPYYRDIRGIKLGFGYDFHKEEYKFVRILDIGVTGSIVEVYREGSNEWKEDQLIPYSFTYGNAFGVLINETLHWIAYHSSGSETRRLILSFSIRDESFAELPVPENVNDDPFRITVGALETDLCIIDYCVCMLSVDVWVMKDYGVNGSWSKLLTIPLQTATPSMVGLKLLHSFKNGEILLKRDKNTLLIYHPKYNETKIVKIRGVPDGLYDIMTYVGSLFSVNSRNCLVEDRIEIVDAEPRKKPKNNFIKGLMSVFKCFSG